MTQITKEAIEAAALAMARDDVAGNGVIPDPSSYRGAARTAIEAALPFLPIAVEGKVKPLDWEGSGWNVADTVAGRYVVRPCLATNFDGQWLMRSPEKETSDRYPSEAEAKRAAQAHYETRILSALISSPGKDGGQEVEAVEGEYPSEAAYADWLKRNNYPHTRARSLAFEYGYRAGRKGAQAFDTQPASTALVDAAYELSTWAACVNWRGKENQPEWLSELREKIDLVQALCRPLLSEAKELPNG